MTEPRAVRGHLCAGLRRFLAAAHYNCIPTIDERGQINGCDDYNPVLILSCPFCGERLPDVDEVAE